MLTLHSNKQNNKFRKNTFEMLPPESIPNQVPTITDMVASQNFNIPISARSRGMTYGSEGSPEIPRLNCDIFDAIDYSRYALAKRLEFIKDAEEKAKLEQEQRVAAEIAAGTGDPTPPPQQ